MTAFNPGSECTEQEQAKGHVLVKIVLTWFIFLGNFRYNVLIFRVSLQALRSNAWIEG